MKKTWKEWIYQWIIVAIMIVVMLVIILPFMHIISVSLSDKDSVTALSVGLFPKGFNIDSYTEILGQDLFLRSLSNTLFVTIIGTVASVLVNLMAAYAFSKEFFAKKFVTYIFVFTMYFGGGLIPSYILMTNWLHLQNSFLAYILPSLVNVFYIIIMRSQIEAIPASLSEAAFIDGASEFQVMFYIILPTLTATIAAIGMFVALSMWNMWFPVMIYSDTREMWTLQYFLRIIVFEKAMDYMPEITQLAVTDEQAYNPQNYQMAAIVLVALPVVAIYPFVQKYFVKGMLTGAVKE